MEIDTIMTADTSIYVGLAALFDDPQRDLPAEARVLAASLAARWPDAASALIQFAAAFQELEPTEREETWLSTFAVAPSCIPYVGVHLHGEESFKRGELLARLKDEFAVRDFSASNELPDHVAVLLSFSTRLAAEERDELESYLLSGPVEAMVRMLSATNNPYRFLIDAVARIVCRHDVPREVRELMAGGGRDHWTRGASGEACGTCAVAAVISRAPPGPLHDGTGGGAPGDNPHTADVDHDLPGASSLGHPGRHTPGEKDG